MFCLFINDQSWNTLLLNIALSSHPSFSANHCPFYIHKPEIYNMALIEVYYSCSLVTMVLFVILWLPNWDLKIVRATVYLKAIMEVYRNTFTGSYRSAIKKLANHFFNINYWRKFFVGCYNLEILRQNYKNHSLEVGFIITLFLGSNGNWSRQWLLT